MTCVSGDQRVSWLGAIMYGGDIMYLICHVTSHDHVIEGSYKFIDGVSLDKSCDQKHCDSGYDFNLSRDFL